MIKDDEGLADADTEERGARRPNPVDAHVGSRVRLRRMLLGMSQERLGEQLGLTFQQVQKYEKGINRIGASRLYELGRILGVGVQFFFDDAPALAGAHPLRGGFGEEAAEGFVVDFLSSKEGVDLNRAFVRISDPKVRRSLVELVRTLAGEEQAQG